MKYFIVSLCCASIIGCSSSPTQENVEQTGAFSQPYQEITGANTIHQYAEQLAQQLFLTSQNIDLDKSVAVGTFLPVQSINGNKFPSVDSISFQLQESLTTLAAQAGLKVVEFKTAKSINLVDGKDIMLSRDINKLNPGVNADYYLTGTYSNQANSFVVNVRLIDTANQNVIAAATDYIPNKVMWDKHKAVMPNHTIHRASY